MFELAVIELKLPYEKQTETKITSLKHEDNNTKTIT